MAALGADATRAPRLDTVRRMWRRTSGGLLLSSCVLVIAACSGADAGQDDGPPVTTAVATSASSTTVRPATTLLPTTSPSSASTTSTGPGSSTSSTSTSSSSPSTVPGDPNASTSVAPTTSVPVTTTTAPPLDVYDPTCVVKVATGDSLTVITDRYEDEVVTPETVMAENGLTTDVIHPDQLLDICPGNSLNDITGEQRLDPNTAVTSLQTKQNVIRQQEKLNELFAGLGIAPLLVDGISGPVTRQRLCAYRVAIGFPASTADMAAGSEEETWLMLLPSLPVPQSSVRDAERWVLMDQTCQIMFVGAGPEQLAYVFPTSTGQPGYETRPQDRSRAFKYDPAVENAGWHDSIDFPAAEDNPLNGNMYKPIYFDGGQAIHGANTVPTSPQSHGCARLKLEHQDLLVAWLGLGDVMQPLYNANRINLRVNVQGTYLPT
jgi:hypothetical protein